MSTIHAVVRGDGVPVVFVHGWSVDHRIMLPLDDAVAGHDRSWRRIYVDLPGFGRSPAGPEIGHADDIAVALDEFIDHEIGAEPFAVVGGSFGAGLARRLMSRRPDQVLGAALICPTAEPISSRRLPAAKVVDRDEALLAGLSEVDRVEFTTTTVRQTVAVWDVFERSVIPGLRAADADLMSRIAPRLSVSPESAGPEFTRPVLMVLGRDDTIVGWRDQLDLAEHYPNSTVALIDSCGHNAHLEYPDLVAAHLHAWLDAL